LFVGEFGLGLEICGFCGPVARFGLLSGSSAIVDKGRRRTEESFGAPTFFDSLSSLA
jgi:hypothetical protein